MSENCSTILANPTYGLLAGFSQLQSPPQQPNQVLFILQSSVQLHLVKVPIPSRMFFSHVGTRFCPSLPPLLSFPSLCCLHLPWSVTCSCLTRRQAFWGCALLFVALVLRLEQRGHTKTPCKCLMNGWTAPNAHQAGMALLCLNTFRFVNCFIESHPVHRFPCVTLLPSWIQTDYICIC